jgi:hypothetical protein
LLVDDSASPSHETGLLYCIIMAAIHNGIEPDHEGHEAHKGKEKRPILHASSFVTFVYVAGKNGRVII